MPNGEETGSRAATWQDLITAEAKKQKVDPRLALAIADVESSFNPAAVSPKGALGLMQLMPATAKRLGVDPKDPVQNIRGGVTELRRLLDENQGDVVLSLRRYNASPQASEDITQPYVDKVLGKLTGETQARGEMEAAGLVGQPPPGLMGGAMALLASEARGGRPLPATQPTIDPGGSRIPEYLAAGASAIGETFDPRQPSGRRNIAGAVGAGTALALTAPVSVPGALLAGGLGAAGAGMTAEAGEQLVGTAPPSTAGVLAAGGQQAAYEVAGQLMLWPIRAVGQRLIASRVGQFAREKLGAARAATMAQLEAGLDAASRAAGDVKTLVGETISLTKGRAKEAARAAAGRAREALEGTREGVRTAVTGARAEGAARIRGAREAGRETVTTAEQRAAERTAGVTGQYEQLVGQAPPAAVAGREAQAVIAGPAQSARDVLGQRIEEAAKTGPPVDIAALKTEAQRILQQEIRPSAVAFPRKAVEGAGAGAAEAAGIPPAAMSRLQTAAGAGDAQAARALADIQSAIGAAQAEAEKDVLKHPALGVISRILNADDVVPFHAAHLFKRELDEAIGTAWEQSVRKKVTNVTKVLRGSLRDALSIHTPYNAATSAYAQVIPLYTKGIAPQLRKAAEVNPESIVRLIRPFEPTKARVLRDLILDQSAMAGKAAEGIRAWDMVRSAWTRDRLLAGGIDGLDTRLAKLSPEFTDVFYGDPSGKQVLQNVQTIVSAYKSAVQQGLADVGAAKEAGRAGVAAVRAAVGREVGGTREAAAAALRATRAGGRAEIEATRRAGEAAVAGAETAGGRLRGQAAEELTAARAAKRAGKKPTPEEIAFAKTRFVKPEDVERLGADIARVGFLHPGSFWWAVSAIRLLRGPRAGELLEWAAYSPQGTRMLVDLLTSPTPGTALADVLRLSGIGAPEDVGTPPPSGSTVPAAVGSPPPR